MNLRTKKLFPKELLPVLVACVTLSAPAANMIWTNISGGSWKTAANWSPNTVPGANDSAVITNNGDYTVTVNADASCAILILGGDNGTPTLAITAGTFSCNNQATVQAGAVLSVAGGNLAGGELTVAGDLNLSAGSVTGNVTVNGNLNWSGGTLPGNHVVVNGDLVWSGGTLSGKLVVPTGHQLVIPAGANGLLDDGTITNNGTISVATKESLKTTGNAFLYNYGQWLVAEGEPISGDGSANTKVYNFGTLRKAGSTTTKLKNVVLNSSGVIDVQDGTLTLEGTKTHSLNTGTQLPGTGRFMVDGATLNLAAGIPSAGVFELASGTLVASGAFNGNVTWSGGALSGTLTIPATRQLNLTGSGTRTMNKDSILNNAGQAIMDSSAKVKFFADAAINNSGTFELQAVNCFSFNNSDLAWFNNTGVLRKTVSSSTLVFGALRLVNRGTIELQAGDLSFTANTHTFADGSVVLGPGSAHVNGATLSLGGAVSFGSPLYLEAGNLSGNTTVVTTLLISGGLIPGNLTVSGPVTFSDGEVSGTLTPTQTMDWSGGTISGTLNLPANAALTVRSGGTRTLSGVLNNAGSVTVLPSGQITLVNGTPIVNSGLFEVQDEMPFKQTGSAKPVFNNTGIFRKTTGIKTLPLSFVLLQNSGTLDVQAGALEFTANNHTFANGTRLTGSGPIRINGATVTMDTLVRSEGVFELAAGYLLGNATVAGSFGMSGGQLPGVVVITNAFNWSGGEVKGTLTVNGSLAWSGGWLSGTLNIPASCRLEVQDGDTKLMTGTLNNYGTWSLLALSQVQLDSGATLNNFGLVETLAATPFSHASGGLATFNNLGTFRKLGTLATTIGAEVNFLNSGVLDVAESTLSFIAGTPTFNEATRITGTGQLRIAGANVSWNGSITNASPIELASGLLNAAGSLNGKLLWSGGTLSGLLTLVPGSELRLIGTATKTLDSVTVTNRGAMILEGSGALAFFDDAIIENNGLFELQAANTFTMPNNGKKWFNNRATGILRKTGSPQPFVFSNIILQNSGTLDLQTGAVSFTANTHTLDASSRVTGPGATLVSGATLNLNGAIPFDSPLQMAAGTLVANGTVNGQVQWSGGAISGTLGVTNGLIWTGGQLLGTLTADGISSWSGGTLTGTLNVPANQQFNILPGGTKIITGVLNNAGRATLADNESLELDSAGQINNSGLFELYGGTPWLTRTGNRPVFNNTGTCRKLGTRTLLIPTAAEFRNAGTLEAAAGIVSFTAGVHTFNSGSTITGAGSVQVDGATVNFDGNITVSGPFAFNSGLLSGVGSFDGNWTWSGGSLTGTLTHKAGNTLLITGSSACTFNQNASLLNDGTVMLDSTKALTFYDRTTINNRGLFEWRGGAGFALIGSAKPVFINSGTFRKTVSTAVVAFDVIQLQNSGVLDVQAGVLSFPLNTHSFSDGSRVIGSAITRFAGATVNLAGTVRFDGPVEFTAGTLQGNATLQGNLAWSGGTIPSGSSGGVFTINGNLTWSGGTLYGALTENGIADWSDGTLYGSLLVTPSAQLNVRNGGNPTLSGTVTNLGQAITVGNATLTLLDKSRFVNGGVLELQFEKGFTFSGNGSANLLNSGTLRKTVSTKPLNFASVVLQNSGTLDLQAGDLTFSASTHSFTDGTRTTGLGTVRVIGATLNLTGTSTLDAPFELASGLLSGAATINANGGMTWSGGTIPSGSSGGAFTVNGNLTWSGGTLNGTLTENGILNWSDGLLAGTLTIPAASRVNVLPPGNGSISGVLQNAGTVVVSNNASLLLLGGTPIVNSGVLELQNEQALKPNGTSKVNFINSGTLRKTISTKLMKLEYVLLQNSGTLDVQAGEISLALNTHNFTDGTRTTGSGAVRVAGATLNVAGNFTLGPPLVLDSGVVAGGATFNGPFQFNGGQVSDTLTVNGQFAWTGGLLKGGIASRGAASWTGGEIDGWLALATNSTLAISGTAAKSIKGGVLTNLGLVTVTSPVILQGDGGAVIQNFGAFNLPATVTVTTPWGGKPTFNNYGALSFTNGFGVFSFPGKLQQFPSGWLELDLAGGSAGTNFGQIINVPNLTLDGTLAIRTVDGFEPALGDRLEIIKCDSRVGTFASYVANTPRLAPDYSATNVTLFAAAPVLTNQPVSQIIGDGTTVTFTGGAYGSQPLSYQWLWNGAPVAGATRTALTFNNVHVDREGDYAVIVSNFWGSVTSTPATLTVILAPSITRQPQSLTVNQGNDAIFVVEASGTHLSYRWKFGDNWLPGATNATLWLTNVTAANAGKYKVEVSNLGGTVTSSEVILTVIIPPTITEQPVGKNLSLGSGVTLSVKASGTTPFSYQWLKDGNALPDANQSSFSIAHMTKADEGSYQVIVANPAGYAISVPAMLLVNTPPTITTQPLSQTVNRGSDVVLSVIATGVPAPTYQWRLNGISIPGAIQPTLLLTNVQPTQSGNYYVSVANSFGAVESTPAKLDVLTPLLSFADIFTNRGIIYTTNGTGHGDNCGAVKEAGEPTHAGKGSATTSVWLSWWAPANGIATFSTLGSDFDTVLAVYRGTNVNALTKVAADDDSAGYHCSQVSFNAQAGTYYQIAVAGLGGACGNIVLSWDLLMTSELLPQITQAPQDYTGNTNENATVQVSFDAFEPTAIQWFFQGQLLPGATNQLLTITNLQDDEVGGYAVRLTAASGRTVVSPPGNIQINTQGRHDAAARNKFTEGIVLTGSAAAPNLASGRRKLDLSTPQRGFSGTQIFSTLGADKDPGEPDHCGEPGGASSWFFLQAPADGLIALDTEGSSFDTVLAVYTSTNLQFASLVSVACDDNSGADGRASKVLFPAKAMTVYLIAVDGVNGASGNVKLNYTFGYPPVLTEAPASQSVTPGGHAIFSVGVEADPGPVAYQWQFQGNDLPSATNAVLTVSNVQPSVTGAYCVRAWNRLGGVTSTTAQLMLSGPLRMSIARPTDGGFEIHLVGSANTRYVLEYSPDLKQWTPLATNLTTTGFWDFTDLPTTKFSNRFYRVKVAP